MEDQQVTNNIYVRAIQNGYMIELDCNQQYYAKTIKDLLEILGEQVIKLKAPKRYPNSAIQAGMIGHRS